jgi:uncharacterized protein
MALSRYLKVYPCPDDPGEVLLFSTRSAAILLLRKETVKAAAAGKLSPAQEAQLTRLGVLVADRKAEQREVKRLLQKLNARNTTLNLTAVLNLDCNFACPYCFEGDLKGRHYMSETTAGHLIDFALKRLTAGMKGLMIDFYGGEPLLSTDRIRWIASQLKPEVEKQGASFGFSLVTNGSLLSRKTTAELVELGLKGVKVTLDGPAEYHNVSRPFKSGAGSFDVILRNLQKTCDLIKIGIGGNYTEQNYEAFVTLLDVLRERGLTPNKVGVVKFDPVFKIPDGCRPASGFLGGCISLDEPWLSKAEPLLRMEILKRGYHTPKPGPVVCMVETDASYVVHYDGSLYKCPAFIGQKAFAVGALPGGVEDYRTSQNLGLWKNETCGDCEYLPLCFGGCRYMSFVRTGAIDVPDCRKAHLDANLETLLRLDIEYRTNR